MPTSPTPTTGSSLKLLRDQTQSIDGVPFKRLLVYRLTVPLPIPAHGVSLFSVNRGFTITSVQTWSTLPFAADAAFGLYDVADGEIVGIISVRDGQAGLHPLTVPELPANLVGPAALLLRLEKGRQAETGNLVFQIAVSGPPSTSSAVDLNQDGVPDELAETLIPLPPVAFLEVFDDFLTGYTAGYDRIG